MPISRFERFLPLAGALAALLFAASMVLTEGMPTVTDGPAELLAWLEDNQAAAFISGISMAYFSVVMLFFATALRQALRSGEPGESTFSSAAFAGGVMLAIAQAFSATVLLGATEAADKGHGSAVTALGYLGDFTWLPWAAGAAVLLIATGLGGLRTAVLPKWLAITTAILGVLCLTGPTGIGVYMVMPIWLLITAFVLNRRQTHSRSQDAEAVPAH